MSAFCGPVTLGSDEHGTTIKVTDVRTQTFAEARISRIDVALVALHLVAQLIADLPDDPHLGDLCDCYETIDRLTKATVV